MVKKKNVVVHSREDLENIRDVAQRTARVRDTVAQRAAPGMTTYEIDQLGKELCEETGGQCAFHNYRGFPGHICVSVDDVIVHGIGSMGHRLTSSSVLSIDVGIRLNGVVGDTATTVVPGNNASQETQHLMKTGQKSLEAGIEAAKAGNRVSDISKAVEKVVTSSGCNVIREFVGHGCGKELHEPPEIPNFDTGTPGEKLRPGMVLAIEPMVTTGNGRVAVDEDGWTARTADGKPAVHFEHMVLITKHKPEVFTWAKKKQ